MPQRGRLTASYWTLAGAAPPNPPRFRFEERATAAAAAGFSGIGLRYDDYLACRERGLNDAELRRIASDCGLEVSEIEFLYGWSSPYHALNAESRRVEEALYAAADCFGAPRLNVGCSEPVEEPLQLKAVAERFAALCDRARAHGLTVALEFLPWTAIPDIATAWRVVAAAGRDNGAVLLDTWHWFRGNPDPRALRAVPVDRIAGVQVNDAATAVVGSLREDTLHRRRLPGEGSFDLASFRDLLRSLGRDLPLAVEVMSDELAALPLEEVARRAWAATHRVFYEGPSTML